MGFGTYVVGGEIKNEGLIAFFFSSSNIEK